MTIKLLIMDVDGTLTDGKIYIGEQGEVFKAFNVKDGMGIKQIQKSGVVCVIITGRTSNIVANRAKELGINEIYQGIDNKITKLKELSEKYIVDYSEMAYIGDDENDMESMKLCGMRACPSDAVNTIKCVANYICKNKGGEGAVREFIEYLLSNINNK